jgi:hypothetical protein
MIEYFFLMGRHYGESPLTLDRMLKEGSIRMPGGSFGEYVETGEGKYTVGMLAEAFQACVDDRTRGGLPTKFAARFMDLHRAGNEHCHIEKVDEEKIYIIDGAGIEEFLQSGWKKYFRHEGVQVRSAYERWKAPHSGSQRQQRNYEVHCASVDELVQEGKLVHLPVVDGHVVLPPGECDEQEFLDKIAQVSGRSLYGIDIERKQHDFFFQNVYTIHYALLGPPHEVRAISTERAVELLPAGFENFYRFEQSLANTG